MHKFAIGDIVKPLGNGNEVTYYVVTDIFSTENNHYYDVSMIFPIHKELKAKTYEQSFLQMASELGTDENDMIINFIKLEREKLGFSNDIPCFKIKKNVEKATTKKSTKKIKRDDIVYYEKIDNINECLDAINDLKTLHKLFGDEAYLQLSEVVKKRLQKLSKV